MSGGRGFNVLHVAEKPSVAKSVATILSRSQGLRTREGRSRYNKIFEFSYAINGRPCHMLVTSVTGHLMELEFQDRYRKWHSCDPADLFQAPVHKFVPEVSLSSILMYVHLYIVRIPSPISRWSEFYLCSAYYLKTLKNFEFHFSVRAM
jgi:hypothetical protein